MNSMTQLFFGRHRNHNLNFIPPAGQKSYIYLIIFNIFNFITDGMQFEIFAPMDMKRIFTKKRILSTGGMVQKNPSALHQTIKHGIALYCMLAMVAVPSGICSHQHRVPDTENPPLIQILPAHYIPNSRAIAEYMMQKDLDETASDSATVEPQPQDVENLVDLPPYHEHIMEAARNYNIDPALIRAIIQAESSYNPQAVSKRGAQGLMQLMPRTARSLGVEDSFNPALNIDAGARYFRQLLDRFGGDEALALAAYNAGSRYVRKYKGVPPFRATKNYIKKVLKYREQFIKETASLGHMDSAS